MPSTATPLSAPGRREPLITPVTQELTMRTHRFDLVSLVFGLVFVALAVVGLIDDVWLTIPDLRLLGPAVLVLAGVALVVTAARNRDERREPDALEREVTEHERTADRDTEVMVADDDR